MQVGADVLDRLQAFFSEANGRLRKRAFIQALCAACDEDQQKLNGGAVVAAGGSICPRRITPEDGDNLGRYYMHKTREHTLTDCTKYAAAYSFCVQVLPRTPQLL